MVVFAGVKMETIFFFQAEDGIRDLVRSRGLGFDKAFRRKWNYYLSYCEAGFDADLIDVQHVVIEKD